MSRVGARSAPSFLEGLWRRSSGLGRLQRSSCEIFLVSSARREADDRACLRELEIHAHLPIAVQFPFVRSTQKLISPFVLRFLPPLEQKGRYKFVNSPMSSPAAHRHRERPHRQRVRRGSWPFRGRVHRATSPVAAPERGCVRSISKPR